MSIVSGFGRDPVKKGDVKKEPDMWDQIDISFQKTMHDAEVAYKTNYAINLIIVTIGIILLASSLVFAYTRGLNPETLTFAGLGIADFTAIFLVNPQFRIQQLLGDLNQIQVVYRTWRDQLGLLDYYTVSSDGQYKNLTFAEIQAVDDELNKIAQQALSSIENFVGAKSSGETPSPPPPDGKGTEAKGTGS